MKNPERFRRALIWCSWIPFAVAGAMLMFHQEASKEVYASTAKLVMDPMALAFRSGMTGPGREERMAEFRATQVELLNSAQVEAGTLERLRLLGRHKPSAEATLDVLPQDGSLTVIALRCSSNDADYATHYLSERIAEYISFRKKVIDSNIGEAMTQTVQMVLQKQKEMQRAMLELERLEKGDPASLREMEEQRLAKLVSEMRGEIERITRAPGADAAAENTAYVNAVKTRQAAAERELRDVAEKNLVIRKTKAELDKLTGEHATWKKRLTDLDEQGLGLPPSVSVLQAATPAVRVAPPVLAPVLKGAAGGAAIGVLMMALLMAITGISRRKEASASALC